MRLQRQSDTPSCTCPLQHTAANMLGCRQPLISIRLSNGGKEGEHRITLKAVAGKVSLPGREQPWETDVYFKVGRLPCTTV